MNEGRAPEHLAKHLGDLLAGQVRVGGDAARAVVRAAVRACLAAYAQGDVCADLADLADPADRAEHGSADQVRATLLASAVCCAADDAATAPAPLVLDAADRLYLLRHFRDERLLLDFVRARLSEPPRHSAAAIRDALDELSLLPAADPDDRQLAAVVGAAASSFFVLTGGPGTGKTYTVARMLAVILALEPHARIALAAPTGKAASRLREALAKDAGSFPAVAAAAAANAPSTLHRLLGYRFREDDFRFGPERRLPIEVVVVDEVSMAEPALLAKLCAALPPGARLILVGDRDQLDAVGAGQVLGDLCFAAAPHLGVGSRLAALVREAADLELPARPDAPPIADAVIALTKNRRFATQKGIGAFAQALARRDAPAALTALQVGGEDLVHHERLDEALTMLLPTFETMMQAAMAGDAETALAAQRCGRALAAMRAGRFGAEAVNRRIERMLADRRLVTGGDDYVGRPILVTRNDPQIKLFNGDLGVVIRAGGKTLVAFADPKGQRGVHLVPFLRLPPHETAWAMTVHKSQGSEFDDVLVVMPDTDGPLWLASLVYTGITRAKQRAILCAPSALLELGLARWPSRRSGLAAGLAGR
ncbi:MAG: exodeoxyribonuclease subunit alpha [Planctomycetota bacterium]|jgi:exodeoxyribonuclease V alpha subunit